MLVGTCEETAGRGRHRFTKGCPRHQHLENDWWCKDHIYMNCGCIELLVCQAKLRTRQAAHISAEFPLYKAVGWRATAVETVYAGTLTSTITKVPIFGI